MSATALQAILRRDRLVVLTSLVAICLLAWLYLLHLSSSMTMREPAVGGMADMPGMQDMPGMGDMRGMAMEPSAGTGVGGTAGAFVFLAAMWIVMMVGMMLPSATPTILLFSALDRKSQAAQSYRRTTLFTAGYFVAWGAFSLLAAAAQAALSHTGFLSVEMAITGAVIGGAVFVLAGLYELTPLKARCLTLCRSPLEWLPRHWKPGNLGALRMGAEHGLYCVGCCWMLMLLLFVGGVMNLLWVAAIAALVLAEKLLPGGRIAARVVGAGLIASGLFIAFDAVWSSV